MPVWVRERRSRWPQRLRCARCPDRSCRSRSWREGLRRGARSGIGAGVFELGGFVVDGGRGDADAAPHRLSVGCRFRKTGAWCCCSIGQLTGLHGEGEVAAFRDLPHFPEREAERLARLVLMKLLPALAEARLEEFGAALTQLQQRIGDHFAPAQGGRYASRRVERGLQRLADWGAAAYGRAPGSDWICDLRRAGRRPKPRLQRLSGARDGIEAESIEIARGCNRGAQLHPVYAIAGRAVRGLSGPLGPIPICAIKVDFEEHRYILHFLTPARHASPFDVNMALDAGFDSVMPYTQVTIDDVAPADAGRDLLARPERSQTDRHLHRGPRGRAGA